MAFRQASFNRCIRFNSAESSDLLSAYLSEVDDKMRRDNRTLKHKTFAPSQFRCDRLSWFRLRGVQPDYLKSPDKTLEFRAMVGTACHRDIQSNLKNMLGDDWLSVSEYLKSNHMFDFNVEDSEDSLESFVDIQDPPVRFACDGLIRWNGSVALIEIKTVESSVWDELVEPKEEHIDQITCYGAMLNVRKVFMLYVNRLSGELKCFQVDLKPDKMQQVVNRMRYVQDMVKRNLAPEGLGRKDKWCNENYCPYYYKCKEYG